MRKKVCLLLLLVGFAGSGRSQSVMLIVHTMSGGEISFALSEKPIVTYRDDVLVLTTGGTTIEYPLANLQKFTFEETMDAIGDVTINQPNVANTVRIYNMSGILVRTIQASVDRCPDAKFSTQDLPSGTYIIKQGTQTYKIAKK